MKTFIKSVALVLLAAALPAAAVMLPMRIPFQGKLINPADNTPRNGSFAMVFKIYNHPTLSAAGNLLYTENQTVTVANGVFAVQIGTVSYLSADVLSGTSAYLGIAVGGDPEMTPRQPLSMSPYAYTALQLVSDKDIRVNSGVAYTTFTTAGNWEFPFGVTAGSATILGNAFTVGGSSFTVGGGSATVAYRLTAGSFVGDGSGLTNVPSSGVSKAGDTMTGQLTNTSSITIQASGATQFSLQTSSGIDMLSGTLSVGPAGGGINATGTGIVASTGTFGQITSTGTIGYSVITSSGISMLLGTLTIAPASRGLNATGTGIVASTATFGMITSTGTIGYSVVTSSGISMGDGTLRLAANSEGINATGTGIIASTATFGMITSTGTIGFSIITSSGIDMISGTLSVGPAGGGINATGTGIVATSATILGNAFTVGGSSFTVGGGSATVAYRLTAGSFVGDGSGLLNLPAAGGAVAKIGDTMTGRLNGTDIALAYGMVLATATVTSTFTVQGNAFSVGGSTFTISGGSITIGSNVTNPLFKFEVLGKSDFDDAVQIGSGLNVSTFSNAGDLTMAASSVLTSNTEVVRGTSTVQGNAFSVGASSFTVSGGSATVAYQLSAASVLATSSVTAAYFVGSGAALSGIPGRLINVQAFTASGNYTPTSGASIAVIELWGGGGAGGSCGAAAGCAAGGGGSGGYAKYYFTNVGAGPYAFVLSTGAAAVATSTGGAASPSTFATGAVTITVNGGAGGWSTAGGANVKFSTGGAGGAVSTNGTINGAGVPGGVGITSTVNTIGVSGAGGSTSLGGGGRNVYRVFAGAVPGVAGVANTGSGGSGGTTGAATAALGGAGASGYLIIWEYD